jgi:hypothetical protein
MPRAGFEDQFRRSRCGDDRLLNTDYREIGQGPKRFRMPASRAGLFSESALHCAGSTFLL